MKLKVFTLYTAGLALLVGAAGTGDGFSTLPTSAWGGHLITGIVLALLGIACLGLGRKLEIEDAAKRRRQRIERPAYRQNRRDA